MKGIDLNEFAQLEVHIEGLVNAFVKKDNNTNRNPKLPALGG